MSKQNGLIQMIYLSAHTFISLAISARAEPAANLAGFNSDFQNRLDWSAKLTHIGPQNRLELPRRWALN
jgi:hypothetical protein